MRKRAQAFCHSVRVSKLCARPPLYWIGLKDHPFSDIYVYERVERQYGMSAAEYLDAIKPDLVITDAKIATDRRVERLLYNELDSRARYELVVRHNAEQTVTLCALGPLTNIATAFTQAPDIVPMVEQIVLMGGGYFEQGNTTPAAEFNIYVDPHAADIVFRSGVPITQVPLDLSHQMLTTNARIAKFRGLGNRAGVATAELLEFFERFDEQKYGQEGGPLHDPCVIAWLLKPELFEGRQINVEIETQSELTMGATVADYWRITDRRKNVFFLRSGDAEGYYDMLAERIGRLP